MTASRISFFVLLILLSCCTNQKIEDKIIKLVDLDIKGNVNRITEIVDYFETDTEKNTFAFNDTSYLNKTNKEAVNNFNIFHEFKFGTTPFMNAVTLDFDKLGNLKGKYLKWSNRKKLDIIYRIYRTETSIDSITRWDINFKSTDKIYANDKEPQTIYNKEIKTLNIKDIYQIKDDDILIKEEYDNQNNWTSRTIINEPGDTIKLRRSITYY